MPRHAEEIELIPEVTEAPPGIDVREIPARPDLEWLLAGEEGEDDVIDPAFFRRMEGASALEHHWEEWRYAPLRFPMPYTSASMIAATFKLPVAQARELLPDSGRLKPLRISRRRSAITFFAFDYRRGGLGAYRELGVALPVILDQRAPPLLPALVERIAPSRWPGIAQYPVELPVDTDRACEAGTRLYGLPKVIGDAKFELSGASGSASLSQGGKKMAELRVELPGEPEEPKRREAPLRTVSVLDGQVIETAYDVISRGHVSRRGTAEFEPGSHPRFTKFKDLKLSKKPVEVRVISQLNWIIWGPRDRGPL